MRAGVWAALAEDDNPRNLNSQMSTDQYSAEHAIMDTGDDWKRILRNASNKHVPRPGATPGSVQVAPAPLPEPEPVLPEPVPE